ncbi:MAG: MbcA/ParS/Xre antitoxin family protein [Desulfuromonadales bacterium]
MSTNPTVDYLHVNITSRESRESLAKMVSKLFDYWGISSADQCALLGLAPTSRMTLNRYRKGSPFDNSTDLLGRAGHLLGIHKSLRIMFPYNRDLAYRWVTAPNLRFSGKTPLEIMSNGYEGLLAVRRYLDFEQGR